MSFYRSLLAAVAAVAIASPVLADEATTTTGSTETNQAVQVSENTDANAAPVAATEEKTLSTAEQVKVNLNKATVKELAKVKGLNVTKAKAVVAYRKKHGDFKSTDDLSNVKGFKKMKPETLKEVTDQLTVE